MFTLNWYIQYTHSYMPSHILKFMYNSGQSACTDRFFGQAACQSIICELSPNAQKGTLHYHIAWAPMMYSFDDKKCSRRKGWNWLSQYLFLMFSISYFSAVKEVCYTSDYGGFLFIDMISICKVSKLYITCILSTDSRHF